MPLKDNPSAPACLGIDFLNDFFEGEVLFVLFARLRDDDLQERLSRDHCALRLYIIHLPLESTRAKAVQRLKHRAVCVGERARRT